MGRRAQVWGFGAFDVDIIHHLPYPEDFYEDVEPGTLVSGLIGQLCTTAGSNALAEILGVDINSMSWEIDKEWVDQLLLEEAKLAGDQGDIVSIVDACIELIDHGWRLFYDPNC